MFYNLGANMHYDKSFNLHVDEMSVDVHKMIHVFNNYSSLHTHTKVILWFYNV